MMGKQFARIVEECLHRLDRGEYLPDVLADYPEDAEHLKPLLLVAMASRSMALPVPSQMAQHMGRNQMMAEMDQVGSASASIGDPSHYRAKWWTARLVNALRARGLIRPAPSYRLAMIALLVIFGSGLFFLSASASPGDVLTAFAADIRQVLTIFNKHPSENPPDYFRLINMNGDGNPLFPGNQAAKLALLLDILEEKEKGESLLTIDEEELSTKEDNSSQEVAAVIEDDDQNTMDEDQDPMDDDQDLDDEKIKDKKPKKEKIIIPGDDDDD